jgi:hypothetical protein
MNDGTAVWNCLTKVDYVTLSSVLVDDPVAWQPNTGYYHHQFVRKDKIAWWPQNDNHYTTFDPAPHQCVSGATGPDINITASNSEHPDGTCFWLNPGTIPYSSSHANAWPHGLYINNASMRLSTAALQSHRFRLWDGGIQRLNSYEAGKNGEAAPMNTSYHASGEGIQCPDGVTIWPACNPPQQLPLSIEPAPGEGICENPGPLAYDRTRGVALFADGSETFHAGDSLISLPCLQIQEHQY